MPKSKPLPNPYFQKIKEIEAAIKSRGLDRALILAKAGISQPTWWRWTKNLSQPTRKHWADLQAALPIDLREAA